MSVLSYLVFLIPHVAAVLAAFFLYKVIWELLLGKVPSSPAAIGRALGLIVFGQLVSFYLLWYFSYLLGYIGVVVPDLSLFHGPIGISFILLAGFIGTRTFEDTKAMNITIICVIGLLPQGLITAFNFNEGVSASIALYLFIPSILLGGYLSQYKPKAINQDK